MAGSANFKSFGNMTSGPADLLELMTFNLCSSKFSDTNIPETEGAGHPVWSICCEKLSILLPSFMPILAKNSFFKCALSLSLTARLSSFLLRRPILLLLTGLVANQRLNSSMPQLT